MQSFIDQGKGYVQQGLQKAAELGDKIIGSDKLDLGKTDQSFLRNIKNKWIGKASDFVDGLGRSGQSYQAPKATHESHKLSGWDKFKNGLAGIWNSIGGGLGLPKAHIIHEDDYKKDKEGNYKFDWKTADQRDKDAGINRGADLGKIVSSGVKIASMV